MNALQVLLPAFTGTLVSSLLVHAPWAGEGDSTTELPSSGERATASAFNVLDCVGGVRDQDGGPCIRASSTPTAGLLLPYPGEDNTFSGSAVVSGGRDSSALDSYASVGGGRLNVASGLASRVGGGYFNTAEALAGTVAGGLSNESSAGSATVGGGRFNDASGYASTIAGGSTNSTFGEHSTIGGGLSNLAGATCSSVAGGNQNSATGYASTVVGGVGNLAFGDYATAVGFMATAFHRGSFVWADSVPTSDKSSSTDNEFSVYADGGVRMFVEGDATGTPSLVVDPDGAVGVGTASPARPLHVVKGASGITPNGNAAVVAEGANDTWINLLSNMGQVGLLFGGSGSPQDGAIVYDPSGVMIFRTGGNVNRMRITAAGDVGIGTATPAELLDVAGNVRCVSLIQTSDARFKRDVRELAGALETVLALRGVSYEWDLERFPAGDEGRHLGFLAQEVRKVAPEAVQEASDGTLSVSYSDLVPLLVEALSDLEREGRRREAEQDRRLGKLEAALADVSRQLAQPVDVSANALGEAQRSQR